MAALVDGLGVDGTLVIIGADMSPMEVSPLQLITRTRSMRGWSSGISADSEDTLRFCAFTGVRPMIETFPLEQAQAAFERMMSGKARYRVVLTMADGRSND
jgi:D-arabinose 1-dehydrogenase-like Zn-dependent alcohol dehydrogenase